MKKLIGIYDYTVILTYLGLMFSLLGIVHALRGWMPGALILLGLSLTCDTFDGRVARAKKGRTDMERQFGIQIDSLCDMVSFGVFPVVLCNGLGLNGIFDHCLMAFYCLCCVIRLAYFNVLALEKNDDKPSGFHGLPVVTLSVFLPLICVIGKLLPDAAFLWLLRAAVVGFGCLYILDFSVNKPKLWQLGLIGCVYLVPLVVFLLVK